VREVVHRQIRRQRRTRCHIPGPPPSADGRTLTLELWGDICTAVSPAGRLTFKGRYTVAHFDGKGRRVADGVGGLDVQRFADATATLFSGDAIYDDHCSTSCRSRRSSTTAPPWSGCSGCR
jgi:hypothetical protein